MLRHLPLLLKLYQTVQLRHLRWAALLFLLVLAGGGSAVGAMTYGWQVTVVRILPDEGQGRGIEAASVPSEVRNFTWR